MATPVADVPAIMQLEFQQFKPYENQEEPQIQFIIRALDVPVVTQMWVPTVQTVQRYVNIPQVQFLRGCRRARCCARQVHGSVSTEIGKFRSAVHCQGGRFPLHRQGLDVPVILQRQVRAFPGDSGRCLGFSHRRF